MKPTAMMVLLGLAASTAGCLTVADERARRDLEIGKASAEGVTVVVDEGLAHVRQLAPGVLTLWAQSPVVALTITREGAAAQVPLEITVENALGDAALTLATGAALDLLATPAGEEAWLTRRRWQLPAGAGAQRLTLAPPGAAEWNPFRVAVFADVQERLSDVQDIYARMNQDPSIRFVLMNGDLTNRGTPEQLGQFQREMRSLRFPIFATLGNHELGKREDLFHDFFGRGSFSFAFQGARFTLLDSASATLSPLTHQALDGWLAAGAGGFHMVSMHIPPLDPVGLRGGGFSSRLEAASLCARMAGGGVNLNVYGHVHSFYSYINAGIPAYITGGGGAIPERFDGLGRHFMTVDIDPRTELYQVAIVRVD